MPFLAPIAAAFIGAGASIAAGASVIAPILTAASAGAGIYSTVKAAGGTKMGASPSVIPQLQQAPRVPEIAKIQVDETQNILRANQKRTKTILTNPLGETNTGIIQKKQLVGKLGE